MVQKLLDLWYAIPREKEWWIDQISAIFSGCATGCVVMGGIYGATVLVSILVCVLFVSTKTSEGLYMGFGWGTVASIVTGSVCGSAVLAAISYMKGT